MTFSHVHNSHLMKTFKSNKDVNWLLQHWMMNFFSAKHFVFFSIDHFRKSFPATRSSHNNQVKWRYYSTRWSTHVCRNALRNELRYRSLATVKANACHATRCQFVMYFLNCCWYNLIGDVNVYRRWMDYCWEYHSSFVLLHQQTTEGFYTAKWSSLRNMIDKLF